MMKKKIVIVACICFVLFAAESASSGEASTNEDSSKIEEMVVTATMTEKIIKDAPGSVEIITEQDILEMNAGTVAQALEEATGLLMTTETGRMMRPSIRGTGNKHTLVLIDGRRIASGLKDLTGLEQIPVDMIDHIEVVRGPVSALYGSDAIGGVVNIITKKTSKKLTVGATAKYGQSTYGDGEEAAGSAYVGASMGRFGFLLAGGYQGKDGYDMDGVTPDDGDDISMKSAGGRFSYELNENHDLLAGFEAVDRNFNGLRDLVNLDRERDTDDRRVNCFLEYDGKIASESSLMLRANHSWHDNEITIDPETPEIAGSIGDESNAERTLDQMEGRFSSRILKKHLLTMGTEYLKERREDDTSLDDYVETYSIYAQDEYQIFDPLYLALSARWDNYSDFGSQWTPRLSMTYAILQNLRLKGAWGMGYRAPGFLELYIPTYMKQGKVIYEPNAGLDPESSQSYEIGIQGEYKNFQAELTCFKTDIEDLIEAVYYSSTGSGSKKKDYYQYQNIAEASIWGVEFECSLKLPAGFTLSGNLAYLDTEDETTGEELEGRPDYKGSVKLAYEYLPVKLRANIRVTYVGERYYADEDADSMTIVDAYVSKDISDNFQLFVGVNNLFNSGKDNYEEPEFFYGGIRFSY
ncbi:TonB-dependent receptor domain-containing protein [uncultured Desulfobacter sp.]|uniref:TonB-dependent receptor plug domain-containing protein n=1 Tax=uncultured Desulfobacter sp. TaxID=240139 RepID=UPI002AAB28C5|nr:TonB-dependent receptor [uncultured Desulfobacter sp.]